MDLIAFARVHRLAGHTPAIVEWNQALRRTADGSTVLRHLGRERLLPALSSGPPLMRRLILAIGRWAAPPPGSRAAPVAWLKQQLKAAPRQVPLPGKGGAQQRPD